LKNFTDINTARKSDTGFGTKDILMKANDQGLKGDARRQYIADQIAKKSSTTDEEKNKGKSILQQQQELLDQKDAQSKIDKEKDIARITQDENTLLATKQKNKEVTDKYFSDIEAQENDYFNQYEAEQNKLLSEGEGTQLNQVRSQIYQALAARGVDISKMPPEQLIALSGDIGTKAFSNIYQMKENVKNRILEKSREKLNRLNDLKSKKTINENEYNEAVQSVNSAANLQRSDVDKQFAQAILGTAGAKIQLGSNVATENANLALTLGKDL
jgi:hypothetical protein